ncbi:MAG TPA: methylated-DNA--[protein]-cysteine S-methyltransferase [Symbiobacteriaceae bacterium]
MIRELEPVRYTMLSLPLLGLTGVGYTDRGICFLSTVADEGEFAVRLQQEWGSPVTRDDRLQEQWRTCLTEWMRDGRCTVPLDVSRLTPFQQEVLAKTRLIPRGTVRPYRWLAREVGRPGACRAVGNVMARNPIPLLIPCHRVVTASGALGQYGMGGPAVKARLLAMEGVDVARLNKLARQGYRFVGDHSSGRFCYPTCPSMPADDEVLFRTEAEARAAGYLPCEQCRPV